jgi:hypothetical protein
MQNVSPQLSNAVQWQIIGMREAGMSLRQIVQGVDHHQSTVAQHTQCSVVAICALCHLSRTTRSDFRRTNELSSTRPNSIDDVFGTIANGKLCVPVLENISLHVFLNDIQQISDDFGLFLQIATDGATTAKHP